MTFDPGVFQKNKTHKTNLNATESEWLAWIPFWLHDTWVPNYSTFYILNLFIELDLIEPYSPLLMKTLGSKVHVYSIMSFYNIVNKKSN